MSRLLVAVVLSSFVVTSVVASPNSRRRSAGSGESKNEAILSGTITDSVTGEPVAQIQISNPPDHYRHSDGNGRFDIKVAMGKDVTLTFFRSGYEFLTAVVNVAGNATRSFEMKPKPTTRVRTTNGSTMDVDTETVEFGYLAPFIGYTKDSTMNLCTAAGSFTPDRSEILRIAAPDHGGQVNNPACCEQRSMTAVTVELKNGSTSPAAGFIDTCFGYREDLIALDHHTGEALYIPFTDIAEVTFP